MILALLNIHFSLMPPSKFWLNPKYDMGALFKEFEDYRQGNHLWYWSQTIWSILNIQITLMFLPSFSSILNTTLWKKYHLKNFRMVTIAAILYIGMKPLPWCLNLNFSLMFLTKPSWFGRFLLKNFNTATVAVILHIIMRVF